MPETKLGGKKEPAKKLIIPPRVADKVPMYGPRSIPIIGAVIAAAVMFWLGIPRIRKIGIAAKTAYNAVKHMIRATSFAASLVLIDIFAFPLCTLVKS
jgi:hypothetical protein